MTQELIDETVFDALTEAVGEEFTAELVTTFLSDAPRMLAELKQAASAEDGDAYRRAAHSIKSNAQVFGAAALADIARGMELAGLESTHGSVSPLEAIFERTATALAGLLDD